MQSRTTVPTARVISNTTISKQRIADAIEQGLDDGTFATDTRRYWLAKLRKIEAELKALTPLN